MSSGTVETAWEFDGDYTNDQIEDGIRQLETLANDTATKDELVGGRLYDMRDVGGAVLRANGAPGLASWAETERRMPRRPMPRVIGRPALGASQIMRYGYPN